MGVTAVAEVMAKQSDDAVAIATLLEEGLIQKETAEEGVRYLMQEFRLASGEAEAIALAQREDALCATDDGPAIRCCKVLGIPFVTAIGFLVALTESGDLDTKLALELLSKLERFGRYGARILEDAARRIRTVEEKGGQP
jgi:predicted nucleic acid-binding protein